MGILKDPDSAEEHELSCSAEELVSSLHGTQSMKAILNIVAKFRELTGVILAVTLTTVAVVGETGIHPSFKEMGADLLLALKSEDSSKFAQKYAFEKSDFRNAPSSFDAVQWKQRLLGEIPHKNQRTVIASSLNRFIERAESVGLDWKTAELTLKSVGVSSHLGSDAYVRSDLPFEFPYHDRVTFVISVRSDQLSSSGRRFDGDFRIIAENCALKANGVWGIAGDLECFGGRVVPLAPFDPEMDVVKFSIPPRPDIVDGKDPALKELGRQILEFLASGDIETLMTRTAVSADDVRLECDYRIKQDGFWRKSNQKQLERILTVPSRETTEQILETNVFASIRSQAKAVIRMARQLNLPENTELFQLTGVNTSGPYHIASREPLFLKGSRIEIKFTVNPSVISALGGSYSGDFVVVLDGVRRNRERWFFGEGIRWSKVPDGLHKLLTDSQLKNLYPIEPTFRKLGEALVEAFKYSKYDEFTSDYLRHATMEDYGKLAINQDSLAQIPQYLVEKRNAFAADLRRIGETFRTAGLNWEHSDLHLSGASSTRFDSGGSFLTGANVFIRMSINAHPGSREGRNFAGEFVFMINGGERLLLDGSNWNFNLILSDEYVRLIDFPSDVLEAEDESWIKLRASFGIDLSSLPGDITISSKIDPELDQLAKHVIDLITTSDISTFQKRTTPSMEDFMLQIREMRERTQAPFSLPPIALIKQQFQGVIQSPSYVKSEQFLTLARSMKLPKDSNQYRIEWIEWNPIGPGGMRQEDLTDSIAVDGGRVQIGVSLNNFKIETLGEEIQDNFVITLDGAVRRRDRWAFNKGIRWERVPDNLVTAHQREKLTSDQYLANYGALMPGTAAPTVSLFSLEDGSSNLSTARFEGKIIVLEFWSTTCGPCQSSMQRLQDLVIKNPEWQETIEFITVSIDRSAQEAKQHLEDRGWNATRNYWSGPGEWASETAKAFSLRSIPALYVIDREGTIVANKRSPLESFIKSLLTKKSE